MPGRRTRKNRGVKRSPKQALMKRTRNAAVKAARQLAQTLRQTQKQTQGKGVGKGVGKGRKAKKNRRSQSI